MRTRMLPRLLVGLVVAGSLAACGAPGGEPPGAILVITPNPGLFDLLPNSLSSDTVVFTVRNVGFANTGGISVIFSPDAGTLDGADVNSFCGADMAPGDTCTIEVSLRGTSAPLGSYEITLNVQGADSGDATAQLLLV